MSLAYFVPKAYRKLEVSIRNSFAHPTEDGQLARAGYMPSYDALFDYYNNAAFEGGYWSRYIEQYKLYRKTRPIYNPVKRLVEFYASNIYPGVLSPDGLAFGDDIPLAFPFNKDIDEELRLAIAQVWQWTNLQSQKATICRTGAMTGNVFISLIDDVDRSKIVYDIKWPGFITELVLDDSDNVIKYVIEYAATDEEGEAYQYKKEVNRFTISTFRDGQPEGFNGSPAEYPNPYGFVPAVWISHTNTGTDVGAPAIKGDIAKIDEVNSIVAHIHDDIHKQIASPQVLATASPVAFALRREDAEVSGIDPDELRMLLKAGSDTSVHKLSGNLDLGDAFQYVEKLLEEIEKDNPELTFWEKLREMSTVTGPGAQRMLGDVQNALWSAASNYDQQMIKLFQMSVAIGGWRVNNGEWVDNRQTAKFEPFDLESYESGDLDFTLLPRSIVPSTTDEKIAQRGVKTDNALKLKDYLPAEQILLEAGYSEEEIPALIKGAEAEAKKRQQDELAVIRATAAARPQPARARVA